MSTSRIYLHDLVPPNLLKNQTPKISPKPEASFDKILTKTSANKAASSQKAEPVQITQEKTHDFQNKTSGPSTAEMAALARIIRLEMIAATIGIGSIGDIEQAMGRDMSSLATNPLASTAGGNWGQYFDINPAAAPLQGNKEKAETSEQSIPGLIDKAAKHHDVDPALIRAVIKAESNFDHKAVSPVGAQGLMQLMPETAKGLGVKNSFDAEQNIMGGTQYLKTLLNKYDGDVDKTLAAYNWGPGNVDRRGLSQMPSETRTYMAKVKKYYANLLG